MIDTVRGHRGRSRRPDRPYSTITTWNDNLGFDETNNPYDFCVTANATPTTAGWLFGGAGAGCWPVAVLTFTRTHPAHSKPTNRLKALATNGDDAAKEKRRLSLENGKPMSPVSNITENRIASCGCHEGLRTCRRCEAYVLRCWWCSKM
jgi:hypothetical protein